MKKKLFFLAAMTAVAGANAQGKIMVDGHEAVDLGLSVLWATCNIGADSPEKPGDYFAWGEVEPKETYSYENHLAKDWTKELDADHDAATQKCGKNWRMPTYDEFEELLNLEWELKEKTGFYVKGNGNSIFLPFTGIRLQSSLYYEKTDGYYWQSYYYLNHDIYGLFFDTNNKKEITKSYAENGKAIRPVCEKSAVTSLNYVEKDNANTVYKTIENGQIVIVRNGVKYNLRGQKL